jgi:hypothetical protein
MGEIKIVLGLLPSLAIVIGKEEGDKIKDCIRIAFSTDGRPIIAPMFMQVDKDRKKSGFDLPKSLFCLFDEPSNATRDEYLKYISKIPIATKKLHVPKHSMN